MNEPSDLGPSGFRDSPEDQEILRLNCYEPAGHGLSLNAAALTRNLLLTGSTGSGKTTLLNDMLFQTMAHRAADPERKTGMVIFDFKQDSTVDKVEAWARRTGREEDLRILREDSPWRLSLFRPLHRLADVERSVEELLVAAPREDLSNPYFDYARRKRLAMALGMVRLTTPHTLDDAEVLQFLVETLLGDPSTEAERPARLAEMAGQLPEDTPESYRLYIRGLLAGWREWEGLDLRTKSNEKSTLSNLLQPLLSIEAAAYLQGDERRPLDFAEVVDAGRIVVLSLPAMRKPRLTAMLARIAKARIYEEIQRRARREGSPRRLVGLFADEFPMVVTGGDSRYSDVTQLQSTRSMGAFMIAATQSFEALRRRIGAEETRALLANFNSHFLFRSAESSIFRFALETWGWRTEWKQPPTPPEAPWEHAAEPPRPRRVPVCPPEILSSLDPGQAFVRIHGAAALPAPLWFVGRASVEMEKDPPASSAETERPEFEERLLRRIAGTVREPAEDDAPPGESCAPMAAEVPCGRNGNTPFALLLQLCIGIGKGKGTLASPRQLRRMPTDCDSAASAEIARILHELLYVEEPLRGLETLPASWCRGLRQLLPRADLSPWAACGGLRYFGWRDGLLDMRSVRTAPPATALRQLQEAAALTRRLYPSALRGLKPRDRIGGAQKGSLLR